MNNIFIFKKRESLKNITHPYNEYKAHIVLGVIYDTVTGIDERKRYTLEQLNEIVSVIKNFQFFVQEKWKIAIDRPGSGNTKNIGSVSKIEDLVNGNGAFSTLGEDVFTDTHPDLKLYVPSPLLELYKSSWPHLADRIEGYEV